MDFDWLSFFSILIGQSVVVIFCPVKIEWIFICKVAGNNTRIQRPQDAENAKRKHESPCTSNSKYCEDSIQRYSKLNTQLEWVNIEQTS